MGLAERTMRSLQLCQMTLCTLLPHCSRDYSLASVAVGRVRPSIK